MHEHVAEQLQEIEIRSLHEMERPILHHVYAETSRKDHHGKPHEKIDYDKVLRHRW